MKICGFNFLLINLILLQYITARKKHNPSKDHHHKPKGVTCDQVPCPPERGMCNLDNECVCYRGYVTLLPKEGPKEGLYQCNYEQKSQMVAFLLEFILSFGAGYFYIGNYVVGSLKFLFCFIFIFIFFALPYYSAKYRAMSLNKLTPYFQCFSVFLFCCWQIVDSILFGMNWIPDSNGIPLKGW